MGLVGVTVTTEPLTEAVKAKTGSKVAGILTPAPLIEVRVSGAVMDSVKSPPPRLSRVNVLRFPESLSTLIPPACAVDARLPRSRAAATPPSSTL
jgi:hypothetical protein